MCPVPRKKTRRIKMRDEDVIYIDVQLSTGVGTDTDGGTGGPRSVETGAEFDYLPENCGGAGIEDETVDI